MQIDLQPYQESFATEWDAFVINQSRNGGIFQERKFLSYHPKDRFKDESLLFYSGHHLIGVLPAACCMMADQQLAAVSHPGSTAGALVYHKEMTVREVLLMLEKAIEYYKNKGFYRLEFRLAEALFSYPTDGELLYLLWHRGFKLVTREICSCVNLENEDNWLRMGRKKNPATIRSLKNKGVQVHQIEDPAIPYSLIAQNLANRYEKKPTHSLEELSDLKSRYPDRIHFWVAVKDHLTLATVVVFVVNKQAVHTFYIAQDYTYARLNVMPILFYEAFNYYKALGFKWFNFGLSSRGDWIKWGILEFKERMGGRATFKDVWALDNLAAYQFYNFPPL